MTTLFDMTRPVQASSDFGTAILDQPRSSDPSHSPELNAEISAFNQAAPAFDLTPARIAADTLLSATRLHATFIADPYLSVLDRLAAFDGRRDADRAFLQAISDLDDVDEDAADQLWHETRRTAREIETAAEVEAERWAAYAAMSRARAASAGGNDTDDMTGGFLGHDAEGDLR